MACTAADAAVITNIGRDHLGDFGSRSLDELMDIKWIVSRAVREAGTLILNADDERLVARANGYPGTLAWFSMDPANPVVGSHTAAGGAACVLEDGELVRIEGTDARAHLSRRGHSDHAAGCGQA